MHVASIYQQICCNENIFTDCTVQNMEACLRLRYEDKRNRVFRSLIIKYIVFWSVKELGPTKLVSPLLQSIY